MHASLEAETRSKADALKQKKKLETDINQLEIAVDHANGSNVDLQKTLKKSQQTLTELQVQIEEEQRQRNEAREAAATAERREQI